MRSKSSESTRLPKIGLALGAGGARGLAHIGVLKVLKEENIPVDLIAGCSIGSIIGVLYANGIETTVMEELAIQLKRKPLIDLTLPKWGLIGGKRIKELIGLLTQQKNFEDLSIPTAVIAADLVTGEKVIFKKGPIADAVRASISVPGVFEPVVIGDRVLVDGGVIDRIPISVVKEMGADFVIAVDVIPYVNRVRVENIFDVITQTLMMMEREIVEKQTVVADCLIHPDVGDISPTTFTRVQECIQRGEEAARKEIHKIKEWIEREKENSHE